MNSKTNPAPASCGQTPSWLHRLGAAFGVQRSLAAFSAAFMRGDDVMERPARDALTRPFLQSAWVRAAVEYVAGEIAGRDLQFFSGDIEFNEPAFAAWWAAPALGPKTLTPTQPRLPLGDVLHQLAAWIALEGEFFLLFDDTWTLAHLRRSSGGPTPLVIAHPQRMRLILKAGVIEGYEYVDAAGHRSVFLPEQVLHWKSFNPYDPWRGAGALHAARIAAEGAFSTGIYLRDLMWNNGDQGFIVIGKNGMSNDAQREQIVADLRAKRAALRRGVPKDLFLNGDITVDHPPERAASAELMASMRLSHQEIFVAFGVPPSMAEVKASYSTGKDSDYYQLIIRTCRPQGIRICGALATIASRLTGRPLTAELNWHEHPVMVEVRQSRVDCGLKLWGTGMPMAQVNDFLGLGLAEYPGWGIGYVPLNVTPTRPAATTQTGEPLTAPAQAEGDAAGEAAADQPEAEDDQVKHLRLLVWARARPAQKTAGDYAAFACSGGDTTAVAQRTDRPASELAQWRELMARRRGTVKAFQSALGRVIMAARIETLRRVEAASQATGPDATVAPPLFDLERFASAFQAAMEHQHQLGLATAGTQLFAELGRSEPFLFPPAEELAFLVARRRRLSGVPAGFHSRLTDSLVAGRQVEKTFAQLTPQIKALFNTFADGDAHALALAETSAVYGAGRAAAMRQAGVAQKRWLASGHTHLPPAHLAANGQTVAADAAFLVDGEALSHPGEDPGCAENTRPCHCVAVAVTQPPTP